jgi:hypothetical protein
LKLWQKQKVKYEIISVYDIEKYIGELWNKASLMNILKDH